MQFFQERCCVNAKNRVQAGLKGIAEVVFLEMGEKFVENEFFKNFGQKR